MIVIYSTSISMDRAVTGRIERVSRYISKFENVEWIDISSDEVAKSFWKRYGMGQLPLVTVDGERVGSIEEMDDAVEFGELNQFLRLNIKASISPALPSLPFESPALPATPFGAVTPPTTSSSRDSYYSNFSPDADSSFNTPSGNGPHRVSIADYMSLGLTEEELAELEREIEAGETFDSASPFEIPTTPFDIPSTPLRIDGQELTQEDDLDGIEITDAEAEKLLLEMDGVEDNMAEISLESPIETRGVAQEFQSESEEGDQSVELDLVEILQPSPLTPDDLDPVEEVAQEIEIKEESIEEAQIEEVPVEQELVEAELVEEEAPVPELIVESEESFTEATVEESIKEVLPVESVEAPVESVEAPVESVEAPAEVVEAPVESVEAPAEVVEEPPTEQVTEESEVEKIESEKVETSAVEETEIILSKEPITFVVTPAAPDFLPPTSIPDAEPEPVSDDQESIYEDEFVEADSSPSPFDINPEAPSADVTPSASVVDEEEEKVEEINDTENEEEVEEVSIVEEQIDSEVIEKLDSEEPIEKIEKEKVEVEVVEPKLTKSQKKRASQKAKKLETEAETTHTVVSLKSEDETVHNTVASEESLQDVSF